MCPSRWKWVRLRLGSQLEERMGETAWSVGIWTRGERVRRRGWGESGEDQGWDVKDGCLGGHCAYGLPFDICLPPFRHTKPLLGERSPSLTLAQYYPVMNDPVSSSVTLMTDPPFKAKLQEDIVEGDPDSVLRDAVRVFHGLSVSGDVTGQVVYAGYGRKSDFEMLQAQGKSPFESFRNCPR